MIEWASDDDFHPCHHFAGKGGDENLGGGEEQRLLNNSRRHATGRIVAAVAGQCGAFATTIRMANAIVTDEIGSLASEYTDAAAYRQKSPPLDVSLSSSSRPPSTPSDEVTFVINRSDLIDMTRGGGLGLELGDVSLRSNTRVVVRSVSPNSLASSLGIMPGWIVVSVNGADAERTNASGVAIYFKRALESALSTGGGSALSSNLSLTFRDPTKFRNELAGDFSTMTTVDATASGIPATTGGSSASTRVAPQTTPNASTNSNQVVTVSQLIPPKVCRRRATTDDLLEISYVGRVVESGDIFDGSSVKINGEGIPGRGNDISIFFVLGKQPVGQFPLGWDVGMEGMCVGERRRLVIPPVLAYGSEGMPRRGIPPNASLQYDVTLVSLNGLATPQ